MLYSQRESDLIIYNTIYCRCGTGTRVVVVHDADQIVKVPIRTGVYRQDTIVCHDPYYVGYTTLIITIGRRVTTTPRSDGTTIVREKRGIGEWSAVSSRNNF